MVYTCIHQKVRIMLILMTIFYAKQLQNLQRNIKINIGYVCGVRNRRTIYSIKNRTQKTNLDSPCGEKNTLLLLLDNPNNELQIMCTLEPTDFHSFVPPITNLRIFIFHFISKDNRFFLLHKKEKISG